MKKDSKNRTTDSPQTLLIWLFHHRCGQEGKIKRGYRACTLPSFYGGCYKGADNKLSRLNFVITLPDRKFSKTMAPPYN